MAVKYHISDGVAYREYCAGLVCLGFADKNDSRTKLYIPEYVHYTDGGSICKRKVEEIAERAFADNCSIVSVELPESLRCIERYAFSGCKNLKRVDSCSHYWSNVTVSILTGAFMCCEQLEVFNLKRPISYLCGAAFKGCHNLEKFNVLISDIAGNAFSYCKIKELTFAPDCQIHGGSVEICELEKIMFQGELKYAPVSTMRWLRSKGVTLFCPAGSNVENLVYDGYKVEIYSRNA